MADTRPLARPDLGGAELCRLLVAEIAGAAASLEGGIDRETGIHRARRHLKRARSLAAVLAPSATSAVTAIRAELRDARHKLSSARDGHALAAAAVRLVRRAHGRAARSAQIVADRLRAAAEKVEAATPLREIGTAPADDGDIAAVASALRCVATRAERLPISLNGPALVDAALLTAYRKARRGFRKTAASPMNDRLHAWRRRVKHLWHLEQLATLPDTSKRSRRLDRLGEMLGLHHDLALLVARIRTDVDLADAEQAQDVIRLARRWMQRLEKRALRRGRKLFRKRPATFAAKRRCAVPAARTPRSSGRWP